jgi:cobaltochelatase CobN
MHLLLAQKGTIADGEEAIDLGQSPADVIFLSAADTELASLAAARAGMAPEAPELRLANLLRLRHPMSVDTYVERTVQKSMLVVVRLLGGETYWPYGLEALHAAAVRHGIKLAVLPGDDKPDPGLERFSTVATEHVYALWRYLVEGGAENAASFLDYCSYLLNGGQKPGEAVPLLKAGSFEWPTRSPKSAEHKGKRPIAAIIFYRALVQSGQTVPITALCEALEIEGLEPQPIFVSSLKDPVSAAVVETLFAKSEPDVVINLTGFAVSSPSGERVPTVLERGGAVVLQAVLASSQEDAWRESSQGLSARDLAMSVALPEVDGRVLSRAIAFKTARLFDEAVECDIIRHEPVSDRVRFVARLAAAWSSLRRKKVDERRIAFVLANYPNRDGRIANGVGLDTPAGTINALNELLAAGYSVDELPASGDGLVEYLQAGPTNAAVKGREIRETISLKDYKAFLETLPKKIQLDVTERWGAPEMDPFFIEEAKAFALPLARLGNAAVGIQPARGYNIDPKETYHSPDLVPPHGYFAFYAHLRTGFEADAIVHMGKHGNLEWLPGKALALSGECYPEAVFGPVPHVYPFIVNDPGEGTQAKRRSAAVIIDHLTPPLTRAESYGPLRELEGLVDEYYEAAGGDPRRLRHLRARILDLVRDIGLDHDAGITGDDREESALEKLDAYLCELKEMQIRDGLHIFGKAPEGRLLHDLIVALARVPRGAGKGGDASLQRAIAEDIWGAKAFDPLNCELGTRWSQEKPAILGEISPEPWRTNGDTVERIELLAGALASGEKECPAQWQATQAVLHAINSQLRPSVEQCGSAEIAGLLTALDGRFVLPGTSGAPTRGRPDVLPTGRNFFSVDCRAVPTETAWELGRKSAELLVARHVQDHGEWPVSIALTAWGTSNMRTGGDDIAQALALIGVKPVWESASRRVTGYEVIPPAQLGRPRVDVVLRISGFFRDAFPEQIALFDRAVRAVALLDEDKTDNPLAARFRADAARLETGGMPKTDAEKRAGYRIFGSQPGAYGAGLQALIDERGWTDRSDLAEAWLAWGSFAYGADEEGRAERAVFEDRLRGVEAVVQNQDNREHDLLDSDDYYQFEGGMAATVEHLKGERPVVYHNDHSRPERPVIRTLEEEIGRVVRARVVNPKWIEGVMRHGYKGAFEIAATVDYLFAFSATTGAVSIHHFEAAYQAYIADERVREFLARKNPAALAEIAERFGEAIDRGLWTAKSNSARFDLAELARGPIQRGETNG